MSSMLFDTHIAPRGFKFGQVPIVGRIKWEIKGSDESMIVLLGMLVM